MSSLKSIRAAVCCCTLSLLMFVSSARANNDLQGFLLAGPCAACHGTDGDSTGAIPTLKGKSANFIRTALKEFKSGASSSTIMGRLARGYTDAEIELLAVWFATRNGH